VRIVLCDDDGLLRESVEVLIPRTGHEVVGIADTTSSGVRLIETARPDAVVFDMSLGYNTDFDVIETAQAVGARVIVFSYTADEAVLSRYALHPTVVPKPDMATLETVLRRLEYGDEAKVVDHERRARPTRSLPVAAPTGPGDVAAFYEAINEALPGDAMVWIEVPAGVDHLAVSVLDVLRSTDRLLAGSTTLRVFLVSGGEEGVRSFLRRLVDAVVLPAGSVVRSIVVAEGEPAVDAFERLKREGEIQPLPG